FETFLALPSRRDRAHIEDRYRSVFRATGVRWVTARDQARRLTRAVDHLARYLGLVGLGALLLGGVGVASAVHVFVKEKLTGVAVLRCLGARQWAVFRSYLLQAGALGSGGAMVGVALGLAVQQALPALLGGVLPVEVAPGAAWGPALAGLGAGLWVAVLFALVPLLAVRDVPPLRALGRDVERTAHPLDPWRLVALTALAASVVALAWLEAGNAGEGLAFAGALAVVTGCLWLTGWLAVRATRRLLPRRARYPVRQGVANLFRPQNQTVAVILALGFGVFVPATVLHVQASLAAELSFDLAGGRPNLLLFDIQPDQAEGVLALLPARARETAMVDPIVPSRIAAVRGRRVEELRRDSTGRG
ncbi:MAG TPA: FtsX-like permease family protein, partial [Longimicrobiales bacterium]|nr:FtsX-like permease family protein [Longimicrobiales bacterium]